MANLLLYRWPSAPAGLRWHSLPFPAVPRVPEAEILGLARRIAGGELAVFDRWVVFGDRIRWRRDWVNQKETGVEYFRRIPYLNFAIAGDHKFIWEINRHQHLVTLAQAWAIDGDAAWLAVIERHLESWWEQNPPQRGINWASALEVAFRAMSWLWVLHWTEEALPAPLRQKMLESLYLHGRHLEANLSVYFSPNTHLQGEAVALHAIGLALGREAWQKTGHRIVREELERQVLDDGAHFELSSYYHVYALDLFLYHAMLRGERYEALGRMAEYLDGLLGPDGTLPLLGDDDGGRLFHPYGPRRGFGATTLMACQAWLQRPAPGKRTQRYFPASGLVCWHWDDGVLYFDGGGFGALSAGHSHADALSLVLRWRGLDTLLDPGTFSYMSGERDRFRTARAHNTMDIVQAEPAGPFSWRSRPEVRSEVSADGQRAEGVCLAGGVTHRRRVGVVDHRFIWVVDTVSAAAGQNWYTAEEPQGEGPFRLAGGVTLALAGGTVTVSRAERSQAYGSLEPCWRITQSAVMLAAAVLDLEGEQTGELRIVSEHRLEWDDLVFTVY